MNSIFVALSNNIVSDYGTYFRIDAVIRNKTLNDITFDLSKLQLTTTDKDGLKSNAYPLSWRDFSYAIEKKQSKDRFWNSLAEGLAAAGAGYSSTNSVSTTNTAAVAAASSYGSGYAIGSGGWAYGNSASVGVAAGASSSTTSNKAVTYNGYAAYQARMIANERISAYNNFLADVKQTKLDSYIESVTLKPGQSVSGYFMVEYGKATQIDASINISGGDFFFSWQTPLGLKIENSNFKNDMSSFANAEIVQFELVLTPAVSKYMFGSGSESEIQTFGKIFIDSFNESKTPFNLSFSSSPYTVSFVVNTADADDAELRGTAYCYHNGKNVARFEIAAEGANKKTFNQNLAVSIERAGANFARKLPNIK